MQEFVGFVVRGLTFGGNLYRSLPQATFEEAWASAQKIEAALKVGGPNGLGSSTFCGVYPVDEKEARQLTQEYERHPENGYICS